MENTNILDKAPQKSEEEVLEMIYKKLIANHSCTYRIINYVVCFADKNSKDGFVQYKDNLKFTYPCSECPEGTPDVLFITRYYDWIRNAIALKHSRKSKDITSFEIFKVELV